MTGGVGGLGAVTVGAGTAGPTEASSSSAAPGGNDRTARKPSAKLRATGGTRLRSATRSAIASLLKPPPRTARS